MDKEAIFPPCGPYHSQQFDHSHFLWFKIIAPTVAADSGKGTNTRRKKGALNLKPHNKEDKPHPSARQKDFTQDITNTGLWKRIWRCAYFAKNTKLCYLGPNDTQMKNQSVKSQVNVTIHNDLDYILQQRFLDETTRVKEVWILKKLHVKNQNFLEGPLKLCLFNSDIIKMCKQLCGEVNNL